MRQYQCATCRQKKPQTAFNIRAGRTHTARPVYPHCKPCRRLRGQDHRNKIRAYIDAEKTRRGGCLDCGETYPPYVMDFDHRPETVKRFELSEGTSRARHLLDEEMAKCDLVCANCHRIRTHARYQSHRTEESDGEER